MINGSASLTNTPRQGVTSGMNVPSGSDGHQHRQVMLLGHLHVVRAKGRGNVHQAGAVLGGDEIAQDHVMGRFVRRQEGEQRMVFHALSASCP